MRKLKRANKAEPTTALINIVFLILIFFMVTGTLDRQQSGDLEFVQSDGLECCVLPDAVVIDAAGVLLLHGDPVADVSERMADMKSEDGTIRLLPSKDLPAAELLGLISHLKTAGAGQIVIVTEDASG